MTDVLMDMNKSQKIYVGKKYELTRKTKKSERNLIKYLKDDLFLNADQEKLDAYLKINSEESYVLKRNLEEAEDFKGMYQLDDALSLFTELYKVEPFKEKGVESLLNFSRIYGLPADDHVSLNQKSTIIHDSIDWLTINLKLMEYRKIMKEFIKYYETKEVKIREKLIDRLQSRIKHIQCTIEKTEDEVVFVMVYEDLFQIAYYQITEALINKSEFRKCSFCKNYFHPTDDRMKYCPALPLRKRSSCEMRHYNQMRNEKEDLN